MPASDFGQAGAFIEIDTQSNLCSSWGIVGFDLNMVERYFSVLINRSLSPEAEDIPYGLEWRWNNERSEERLFNFQCSLESEVGDFFRG